jgi:Asp-tRNA(Asn)/Glu-tRNA(Gln) amidotransferase C subunit
MRVRPKRRKKLSESSISSSLASAITDGVVPMAHPWMRHNDDVVTDSNERSRFQENTATVADGLYLVPAIE